MSYIRVDDAAKAAAQRGRGAKVDIKNTYRMVPVHPEDRPLLGMIWEETLYVDASLPFAAPKTLAEWILKQEGITI